MSNLEPPVMPDELSDTAVEGDEAFCVACNQSFSLDQMFCPTDGSKLIKLRSSQDQLLGRVFDQRYELRAVLGQGGMGTVYRAWQISVDREVAIKVIHPKLASVREVAKRFLREARLVSRLSQPNIVNVYDFGQSDDGILYLVMELLRGRPLSDDLNPRKPLPLRRITTIAAQICDALESAHNLGIIHRDLKPHNIILLEEPPGRDLIKILDFGLAKSLIHKTSSLVTQTDAVLGTPAYMSPEQILGQPIDARSDLYSLGCVLYQMASGLPPFRGATLNAVLGMHLRTSPPALPDSVPPALATLIARLMKKDAEARPATAAVVHSAITAIASGDMAGIRDVSARSRTARFRGVGPRRVGGIAIAGVAIVAFTVLAVRLWPAGHASSGPLDAMPKTSLDAANANSGSTSRAARDASIIVETPVDAVAPSDAKPPAAASTNGSASTPIKLKSHTTSTKATSRTTPADVPRNDNQTRNPAPARPGDAGLPELDLIPTAGKTNSPL